MSSIGRPLIPPDLLMRSTAIWVPTRAVLPPEAAVPESGCSVPILYGFAWPKAVPHGAGTNRAPSDHTAARDLATVPEFLTPLCFLFVSHRRSLSGPLRRIFPSSPRAERR